MVRKKICAYFTAFAILISMFAAFPKGAFTAEAVESYELWVAGKMVTSQNKDDILGTGVKAAVYDPVNNVLEINRNITSNEDFSVIRSQIKDLTIKVNNDVTLKSPGASAIISYKNTVITGPGKLTAVGCSEEAGIFIGYLSALTIKDAHVTVSGKYGIQGNDAAGNLTVENSDVIASGTEYAVGSIKGLVSLNKCVIVSPAGAAVEKVNKDGSFICDSGHQPAKNVTIEKETPYELSVAGVQVTNLNRDDILGKGNKEAVYDPDTKTLELNATIRKDSQTEACIDSSIGGLTIRVNKDLNVVNGINTAITLCGDTTITGSGRLTVLADNAGIYVKNSVLTIEDASVHSKGKWGIAGDPGNEKLRIDNSDVLAEGSAFAIGDFNNGIFVMNSIITDPIAYTVTESPATIKNGDSPATTVRIEKLSDCYDLWVAGKRVTNFNRDDILGNNEAVYVPSTNTLFLNGDISSDEMFCIRNSIPGLTISAKKDVTVRGQTALGLIENTTVTGPGKLSLISHSSSGQGVWVFSGKTLTVKNANIYINAKYGMKGGTETEILKIANSFVTIDSEKYAAEYFAVISLRNCRTAKPVNAILGTGIYESNGCDRAVYVMIIPNSAIKKGDVNCDGVVDVKDLTLLARALAKWTGYEEQVVDLNADVDDDGEVTVTDYTILARALARWNGYEEKYGIVIG